MDNYTNIIDGFHLVTNKPIDDRFVYATLTDLKNADERLLYDGIHASVIATNDRGDYEWYHDNEADINTGKWRKVESGGKGKYFTKTIKSTDWNATTKQVILDIDPINKDSIVLVQPVKENKEDWVDNDILVPELLKDEGQLGFICETIPSKDITVNIAVWDGENTEGGSIGAWTSVTLPSEISINNLKSVYSPNNPGFNKVF